MPNGEQTVASEQALLENDLREPAKIVDMVRRLQNKTLLSTGKFADAGYATVFTADEVNIYDATKTENLINEDAILRGW